jgi:hypothetical protein
MAETVLSEYQYYEFLALDRPLDEADRKALRALSTRARITATSFTNSYEWGDFKGDPVDLMERWFDLHLYLTNWGTHRLMIRLPKRLVDQHRLGDLLNGVDCVVLMASGENLIVDALCEDLEPEDDWDDGSGWLAELAPLRADVLGGDLRLFYLLWLTAVEGDAVDADATEPLPGIGPMTEALHAFARFFGIDQDLVAAAAERSGMPAEGTPQPDAVRRLVARLPDREKTGLLARLVQGDAHVASELRAFVRDRLASETSGARPAVALRTVGELRARAEAIRQACERNEEERLTAERNRQAAEQERARRVRLDAILGRGEDVWLEIETEIARRNSSGYDKAAGLLLDLKTIADEHGTAEDFSRRLRVVQDRHARKERFIERLRALGQHDAP